MKKFLTTIALLSLTAAPAFAAHGDRDSVICYTVHTNGTLIEVPAMTNYDAQSIRWSRVPRLRVVTQEDHTVEWFPFGNLICEQTTGDDGTHVEDSE